MRLTNFCWLLLLPAMATTSGCGQSTEKTGVAPSQVAARVNADEISVHQVNAVLGKMPGIAPENAPQARREALDKLIEQQLAVQQAIEMRLDRTPTVMQSIEAAKAEILARAYQEQVVGSLPPPTTEESRKFYDEHPELFAQRRIYNLRELVLVADAATLAELKQRVAQGQSLDDIAAGLKAKGVRFDTDTVARPAEQIPLEFLPKYQALQNGQSMVIDTPQAAIITTLISSQLQPVDEAAAQPRIQSFLANRRAADVLTKEIKQLRDKARIELIGEFAHPAAPGAGKSLDKGVVNLK